MILQRKSTKGRAQGSGAAVRIGRRLSRRLRTDGARCAAAARRFHDSVDMLIVRPSAPQLTRSTPASRRTSIRKPSCLISCSHPSPAGGFAAGPSSATAGGDAFTQWAELPACSVPFITVQTTASRPGVPQPLLLGPKFPYEYG